MGREDDIAFPVRQNRKPLRNPAAQSGGLQILKAHRVQGCGRIDKAVDAFFSILSGDQRIERLVAPHHLSPQIVHLVLGDTKRLGEDCVGFGPRQGGIAVHLRLDPGKLPGGLSCLSRIRPPDDGCICAQIILHLGPDPPHGVGRQPVFTRGIETVDGLHETDVRLLEQVRVGAAPSRFRPMRHRVCQRREGQDKPIPRQPVTALLPCHDQRPFVLRREHLVAADRACRMLARGERLVHDASLFDFDSKLLLLISVVKMISLRYQIVMTEERQISERIAELIVHLGRAARIEGSGSDLTAAQWTCLRFFARANGVTRTPSSFASFQATTRGTASQIIKSLESRGLIARTRSDQDRRSVSFDLTETGRTMLANDPLRALLGVIDRLGTAERDRLFTALSDLSGALSTQREAPVFGSCQDCTHFCKSDAAAYCDCMAAELAADEIEQLCARYAPARGLQPSGVSHGTI